MEENNKRQTNFKYSTSHLPHVINVAMVSIRNLKISKLFQLLLLFIINYSKPLTCGVCG